MTQRRRGRALRASREPRRSVSSPCRAGFSRAATSRRSPCACRRAAIKTIGRTARADFIVDAALVSRLHCRLTADTSDQLVVEDLGSTNGTMVNGKKVDRGVLRAGDTLTVGRVDFRCRRGIDAVRRVGQGWGRPAARGFSPTALRPLTTSTETDSSVSLPRSSCPARGPDARRCHPETRTAPSGSIGSASRDRRPADRCGRSIRQTACRRRTARASSVPSRPIARQTPPGQCPGVCRMSTMYSPNVNGTPGS